MCYICTGPSRRIPPITLPRFEPPRSHGPTSIPRCPTPSHRIPVPTAHPPHPTHVLSHLPSFHPTAAFPPHPSSIPLPLAHPITSSTSQPFPSYPSATPSHLLPLLHLRRGDSAIWRARRQEVQQVFILPPRPGTGWALSIRGRWVGGIFAFDLSTPPRDGQTSSALGASYCLGAHGSGGPAPRNRQVVGQRWAGDTSNPAARASWRGLATRPPSPTRPKNDF